MQLSGVRGGHRLLCLSQVRLYELMFSRQQINSPLAAARAKAASLFAGQPLFSSLVPIYSSEPLLASDVAIMCCVSARSAADLTFMSRFMNLAKLGLAK